MIEQLIDKNGYLVEAVEKLKLIVLYNGSICLSNVL